MPTPRPTLTAQLTAQLDQLAGRDVTWEQLAATYRLTLPLQRSPAARDDLETAGLLAATQEALSTARQRLHTRDPDSLLFHNRFAADLLAAHRQPGWVSYPDTRQHPHASIVPADHTLDLLPTWQAWLDAHLAGEGPTAAYEAAGAATDSAHLHPDAAASSVLHHVARWAGDLHALRVAYLALEDTGTVLVLRRWRTVPLEDHPLLAAAIGHAGLRERRGTALLQVSPLIGRWALRNPDLHPWARVVLNTHVATFADQLALDGVPATLERLWDDQVAQLRADSEVFTLHS